jgi:hypothetical protein
MRNPNPLYQLCICLVGLALLAGCSMLPLSPGAASLDPTATAAIQASTAVPASPTPAAPTLVLTVMAATSEPGSIGQPGNGSTATASPAVPPTGSDGQELSITLADQGQTVKLKVGQRFVLNLGSDYDWNPVVENQAVVSRVVGILVIRGAQGIYEARSAGQTQLTASGDPTCLKSKPACAMPSRLFQITIVVEP